jgi:hypothetical protein
MAIRVTEIRIDRTKSLGNYENIKLGFSAIVDESENVIEAVERLKLIIDWELNKEEREAQYERFSAQLKSGETNGKTEQVKRWIDKYESQQKLILCLSF